MVSKDSATYSRSDREPQLFRYRARFTALKDMYHPNPVDPSPNFVVTIPAPLPVVNYAPTTVLPNTAAGNPDSRGDEDGVVDARKQGSSTDKTVSPYVANSAGADAFVYYGHQVGNVTTGDVRGTTGVPATVGALGDMWYPRSSGYPVGMWAYVIQANRNYFINRFRWDTPLPKYAIGQITVGTPGVSRDEALASSQITLWMPRVNPAMANPSEVAYTLGVNLSKTGYDPISTTPSGVEQVLDGIGSAAASASKFRGTVNPLGPGPVQGGRGLQLTDIGQFFDNLGTALADATLWAPQPKHITGGGLY
jgi:hypothetical protein